MKIFSMNTIYLRRAIAAAIAILLAIFISHHFSFPQEFLVSISAVIIMQVALGNILYQGLQRFLVLILATFIASIIVILIPQILITILLIVLLSIASFQLAQNSIRLNRFPLIFIVVLVITIIVLAPHNPQHLLYKNILNATLGSILGLLMLILIPPGYPDIEFRKNLIPVLNVSALYLSAILDLLFQQPEAEKLAAQQRLELEKIFHILTVDFPGWVYEPGYSVALRQGHRHFLVRIEQLIQLFFSMHQLARHPVEPELVKALEKPLRRCIHLANELLLALATVLDLKKLQEGVVDFQDELEELERIFQQHVPVTLELLESNQDYAYLAEFIYDLKDVRAVLLKLAQALR